MQENTTPETARPLAEAKPLWQPKEIGRAHV